MRRKRTRVRTDATPRSIEDHKLFKKIWIHASKCCNQRRRRKGDRKIANGKRSLKYATTATNFESALSSFWNFESALLNRVFEVARVALLVKQGISRSKNKHKPTAIDDSCMWKGSGTYGLFSHGIDGYPPLTLIAHHTYGPSSGTVIAGSALPVSAVSGTESWCCGVELPSTQQ